MTMCDSSVRPCVHNDWDDVRTRHGYKLLRCRLCQGRWKLPSSEVPRCMAFLHNRCAEACCEMLHVRRKKSNIVERYEQFGDCVLKGVSRSLQKKAKRHVRECRRRISDSSDDTDDEGPPPLLDEDVF
eukprot:TRINITY_DN1343_c0_g1_i1.p1 TRINITY_DN1343_c0_g1~~TRINITY_DN1343_c0_g1_i1.p1  ORF type:complete len:128 (+),score=28.65 TRINITY_DN1343_c0_g1_i1:47-430(+)